MQLRSGTVKFIHQALNKSSSVNHTHVMFEKMCGKSVEEFTQFVNASSNEILESDLIAFIKNSRNRHKINAAYFRLMKTADLELLRQLVWYTGIFSPVDFGYQTTEEDHAVLVACETGRIDVLEWLINDLKLSIHAEAQDGDDAVLTAVWAGQTELLHALIKPVRNGGFGLKFNLQTKEAYRHPVMRAIHQGNLNMLRELVKPVSEGGFGLSLDVQNQLQYGPAMQAALRGEFEIFQELMKPEWEGGFDKQYSILTELKNYPYDYTYSGNKPYVMSIQHSRIAPDGCETLNVFDMQKGTNEVYKLGNRLGSGTYGSVFEFNCGNKKFAVKVPNNAWQACPKKDLSDEYLGARDEFEMLRKAYPDEGPYALQSMRKREEGEYYASWRMVMPYVPGQHIQHVLAKISDPLLAANVILKSIEALQEVHERGVMHGDIRPGNILVNIKKHDVSVHIIDFGFAYAMDWNAPKLLRDSNGFFAPERIGKFVPAHPSQDVWSIARTIEWCLEETILRKLPEFPAVADFIKNAKQIDPQLRPTLPSFIRELKAQIDSYESKPIEVQEINDIGKRHQYVTSNRFFVEDKMRKKTKIDLDNYSLRARP